MSFPALRWAFEHALPHTSMPPTERLLLLILADQANGQNLAWPSYARLAQRSGLSERRCQQAIRALIELGLVERVWRTGTRGKQTSNMYRLMTKVRPGQPVDKSVDDSPDRGENDVEYFAPPHLTRGENISPLDPVLTNKTSNVSTTPRGDAVDNNAERPSLAASSMSAPARAKEVRQVDRKVGRKHLDHIKSVLAGTPS